jgi:hypothetical protein
LVLKFGSQASIHDCGRYGNQFFVRENGENAAVLQAVGALTQCLAAPEGCKVSGLERAPGQGAGDLAGSRNGIKVGFLGCEELYAACRLPSTGMGVDAMQGIDSPLAAPHSQKLFSLSSLTCWPSLPWPRL